MAIAIVHLEDIMYSSFYLVLSVHPAHSWNFLIGLNISQTSHFNINSPVVDVTVYEPWARRSMFNACGHFFMFFWIVCSSQELLAVFIYKKHRQSTSLRLQLCSAYSQYSHLATMRSINPQKRVPFGRSPWSMSKSKEPFMNFHVTLSRIWPPNLAWGRRQHRDLLETPSGWWSAPLHISAILLFLRVSP